LEKELVKFEVKAPMDAEPKDAEPKDAEPKALDVLMDVDVSEAADVGPAAAAEVLGDVVE
jgi:hypothetical protein